MGALISKPADASFLTIADFDASGLVNDAETARKIKRHFPQLNSLVLENCLVCYASSTCEPTDRWLTSNL
jgi:hypothetical protein